MKIMPLIMGVVLLAIVCSPALAISKSDLISQYQTNPIIHPTSVIEKSTVNSLLNLPPWAPEDVSPSLYNFWQFNAWQSHDRYRYIYEPCDFCDCDVIHFTLPDGTIV